VCRFAVAYISLGLATTADNTQYPRGDGKAIAHYPSNGMSYWVEYYGSRERHFGGTINALVCQARCFGSR
jgi:hypothetical protein